MDELDEERPDAKAGVHDHGHDEPQFGEDRHGLAKVVDHAGEVAQTAGRQEMLGDEVEAEEADQGATGHDLNQPQASGTDTCRRGPGQPLDEARRSGLAVGHRTAGKAPRVRWPAHRNKIPQPTRAVRPALAAITRATDRPLCATP